MNTLLRRRKLAVLIAVLVCAGFQFGLKGHTKPPPGAIVLDSSLVNESSGLARSNLDEQLLWTHNDSGDSARLFAFTRQCNLWAVVTLDGAKAVDWEDMCAFTHKGKRMLAVADVGDNGHGRDHVVIYGLEEPKVESPDSSSKFATRMKVKVQFQINVRYPSGPQNCEAIAYDPWREQFVLASKEQFRSRIYALDFDPAIPSQDKMARQIGTVIAPLVTGAAISDDGRSFVLATYGPSCLLKRDSKADWDSASAEQRRQASWNFAGDGELKLIPAPPRQQGEAVCFDKTGTSLLMTSEGSPMPLWSVDVDAR